MNDPLPNTDDLPDWLQPEPGPYCGPRDDERADCAFRRIGAGRMNDRGDDDTPRERAELAAELNKGIDSVAR